MNDPTAILEQARQRIGAAEKWGGMATATRRFACVSTLTLLFLVIGVGGVPSSGLRAQESLSLEPGLFDHGLTLPTVGKSASADTLAEADQELVDGYGSYDGMLSTRARHKTH